MFHIPEKTTFFAASAKLNEPAMVEYGLKLNDTFIGRRNTEISDNTISADYVFE